MVQLKYAILSLVVGYGLGLLSGWAFGFFDGKEQDKENQKAINRISKKK